MKKFILFNLICLMVLTAGAQEYGRSTFSGSDATNEGLGRASLPPAEYDGFYLGGSWGMKISLGWARVSWDIGSGSGKENIFAPRASVFYKTTDNFDVSFSALYISSEDDDDELGKTEGDMTELAIGIRYWFSMDSRVAPYVGCGLGYCFLDAKMDKTREGDQVVDADVSVDDSLGAFIEGGVSYQISDNVFMDADITYDFLLGDADATINGKDKDFNINSLAFNLGVTWMF
ncbi:MAG: porin family protein [Verrucomicrobiae bacterium]|nr:porin family protein [Verrucomicrobiae bacterium]